VDFLHRTIHSQTLAVIKIKHQYIKPSLKQLIMKSILFITLLSVSCLINAQEEIMKFNNQGYLGIGTSLPVHRLTVNGVTQIQRDPNHFFNILVDTNDNGYINLGGASLSTNRIGFQINSQTKMSILQNGNVGIGTNTPNQKLTVRGVMQSEKDANNYLRFFVNSSNEGFFDLESQAISKSLFFRINGSKKMTIKDNGYVGIGTTIPTSKLTVHGGDFNTNYGNIIVNNGSFIDDGVPVADYVFSEDYNLISIEEQGLLMTKNKHLPKVDSEKQIKEAGFYDMAIRREQILEEVEKAHLYIQQLNEIMKEIREKNKELIDKVDTLIKENITLKQEIGKIKNLKRK